MRAPTKQILAIALVGVMVAAAGCTGWGTDGPADNQSDGSDTGDDLENEQNQSQSDGSSSSDSDSGSDTGDSSDASPGESDGDSASDDPAPDSDTGSSDDGESSDGDTSNGDSDTDDGSDGTDGSDSDDQSDESDDGSDGSDGTDGDDGDDGTDGDDGNDTDEIGAALSVTVEDQDGNTVEGIEVVGIGPDAEIYSADTNADGQATYDDLPAGDYEYHVTTDGTDYEESTTESISLDDGDDESLTVTVSDTDAGTEPGASLTVTVEDQAGNAVEGVEVVGIGPDAEIYSATTNSDGQATYDSLPAGDYEYHVTTDGTDYEESSTEAISLADGDDESLTVTVSDTDSGEPETSTLTVAVDNHNGEPIENASVTVITADSGDAVASGTTDSNGIVTFDVENGEYDIIVEHEDITGDAASRVTVDGDTEDSLTLDTSDQLATGIVNVVDQNGDPVEGEPVTLWPPGTVEEEATETRETDENGEVRIELAAGEPEDVVMFDVEVRDQKKLLGIMADAYQGVQEVTFEVDTAENGENETGDVNETNATVALASVS